MRLFRLCLRALPGMAALVLFAASVHAGASAPTAGLFQPALSPDGSRIVFVSGGALWTVPASGGAAQLLLADQGADSRPLFSPDGRTLAFVSAATGGGDIYTLELATGRLTRLTFADGRDRLSGFSPDGQWVYFDSARDNIGGMNGVYRVHISGGTPLPVSVEPYRYEEQAVPAPDGETLALVGGGWGASQWWRHGSAHIDHGAIWLLANDGSHRYTRLSADDARANWPMWAADGGSVYYVSDRGGVENIWRVQRDGTEAAVTRFTDGRVLWPSMSADGRRIAFGRDFGIWTFDTATGQVRAVPITLAGAVAGPVVKHVVKHDSFDDLALSPDGKKLAFIVHGRVFAAGTKKGGAAQPLAHAAPGVAYDLTWAADNHRLVYGAFRGHGRHLYQYDFRTGQERQLTHGAGQDTVPLVSPDGKQVAFLHDGKQLRVLTLATGKVRTLATGQFDYRRPLTSSHPLAWSPDGRWLALLSWGPRLFRNVLVVPASGGKATRISRLANTFADDVHFSPDGKQLLFTTGQRTKQGQVARIDLVPRTPRFGEDAFLDLFKKSTPPPAHDSDGPHGKQTADAEPKPSKPVHVRIDAAGIEQRLQLLPTGLDAQSIAISPDGDTLVLVARVAGHTNLYAWPLDPLATDAGVARQLTSSDGWKQSVQFSADGKTVYYLEAGKVRKVALDKGSKAKPVAIKAAFDIDFTRTKMLAFAQAWSWLRDNFHDPAMHGVDWAAVRDRYRPLIATAPDPASVNRLMNRMVGELDASHSGVRSSTHTKPVSGRLGLRFATAAGAADGALTVAAVVPLSPAAIAGIEVGEVVQAVNGHTLGAGDNYYALLAHRIERKTRVRVGRGQRSRTLVLKPINSRRLAMLAYRGWVQHNRALVDQLSHGRLGYVHLPDMSRASLKRLYRELDADNMNRRGVVIDVRNNYGGFVNAYVLDVLARRPYLNMTPRGFTQPHPARSILGQRALERPTVLITNRITLSDGEDFSAGYRALGLGQVVGEPTAGWIIFTSNVDLVDGASVRLPFSTITTGAGAPMEGHPRPVDVPVTRPLGESHRGQDSDLSAAVHTLLGQLDGPTPGAAAASQ